MIGDFQLVVGVISESAQLAPERLIVVDFEKAGRETAVVDIGAVTLEVHVYALGADNLLAPEHSEAVLRDREIIFVALDFVAPDAANHVFFSLVIGHRFSLFEPTHKPCAVGVRQVDCLKHRSALPAVGAVTLNIRLQAYLLKKLSRNALYVRAKRLFTPVLGIFEYILCAREPAGENLAFRFFYRSQFDYSLVS